MKSEINQFAEMRTENAVRRANRDIERYTSEHEGRLPDGIEGNKLVLAHRDGWDNRLRYDFDDAEESFGIRSAGPDGEFDNDDDLVYPDGRANVNSAHR